MYSAAPIAAVLPLIPAMAEAPVDAAANPYSYLMQLGVGGVLVAFAVWLQDKFSKERRKEVDAERERTTEVVDQLLAEKDARIAALEKEKP